MMSLRTLLAVLSTFCLGCSRPASQKLAADFHFWDSDWDYRGFEAQGIWIDKATAESPRRSVLVNCIGDRHICIVGESFEPSAPAVDIYDIESWTPDGLTASSSSLCERDEIRVLRPAKTVLWVRSGQPGPKCDGYLRDKKLP